MRIDKRYFVSMSFRRVLHSEVLSWWNSLSCPFFTISMMPHLHAFHSDSLCSPPSKWLIHMHPLLLLPKRSSLPVDRNYRRKIRSVGKNVLLILLANLFSAHGAAGCARLMPFTLNGSYLAFSVLRFLDGSLGCGFLCTMKVTCVAFVGLT